MQRRKPIVLFPSIFLGGLLLGWLFGLARTDIVAHPGTIWTLELLKIFGPATIALIAAWLGFKLANRGRKYEILYKERYKSFEEVAGFLYEIKSRCQSHLPKATPGYRELPAYVPELSNKIFNDLSLIAERQPNRRHLVLLSNNTREAYYSTALILERTMSFLGEYIPKMSEHYSDSQNVQYNMAGKQLEEALSLIRELIEEADKAIHLAFKDLDLPQK